MRKAAEDFQINPDRLDRLVSMVKVYSVRAKKDGLGPIELALTAPDRAAGEVALTYAVPAIGGYTLLARISHSKDRYAFITPLGGARLDFDQVRKDYSEPRCQHCGLARARKTTFLLRNEDGGIVQVGSTCLKEFLGDSDPKRALLQADLVSQARELIIAAAPAEKEDRTGRLPTVEEFLSNVLAITEQEGGFVYKKNSGEDQTSTAELAIENFRMNQKNTFDPLGRPAWVEVRPEHVRQTKEKIAEFTDLLSRQNEKHSDFDHRILQALEKDVAWPEKQGMLATVFERTKRLRQLETRLQGDGPWLGEVGETTSVWATLVWVGKPFRAPSGGESIALHFSDTGTGAAITCFQPAGELPSWLAPRWNYPLSGTVRKHDEFKGQKVTVLDGWAIDLGGQGKMPRPANSSDT